MVTVFHKVQSDKVEDILLHELVVGASGDKRSAAINKTDEFLIEFCTVSLTDKGVDRKTNIYKL